LQIVASLARQDQLLVGFDALGKNRNPWASPITARTMANDPALAPKELTNERSILIRRMGIRLTATDGTSARMASANLQFTRSKSRDLENATVSQVW
jgi:hypothetical protein